MSVVLVLIGSMYDCEGRIGKIRSLMDQRGYTFDESSHSITIWVEDEDQRHNFVCCHYEVDGPTIANADTTPEVREFMFTVLSTPGVYTGGCPECMKRVFLQRNGRT